MIFGWAWPFSSGGLSVLLYLKIEFINGADFFHSDNDAIVFD